MKYFLQRTSDLVLISKPCARSGRMVPFYFSVKNARNERPLSPSIMGTIGEYLAEKGWTLNTGAAPSADQAFAQGA